MTKRQCAALAKMIMAQMPINESHPFNPEHQIRMQQWESDKNALADFCEAHSHKFNRTVWLGFIDGVCGPDGGHI